MTWLAPWAFVGLTAMALPIAVHWLARHQADRRLFPTVRFLPLTPPTSVRRHQLTDVALLALRCAIVAAAAAALAQPALTTPPAPGGTPPRAVVVDTSASLQRPLAGDAAATGATAAEAALAATLADADLSVVIREPDVRRGVALAGAWLRAQPGAGEVVVISDFQVGALSEADFDVLPASAARRFVRVGVTGDGPAPARAGTVRVVGAPAAEAAARAVVGDLSGDVGGPAIVVAFEGAPEFAALKASAQPIDTPAAYTLAAAVAGDPKLNTPDVFIGGGEGLVLLSSVAPDSVDAAALIARAMRAAAAPSVSFAEREPDTLDAATIDAWHRDARPGDAPRSGEPYPLSRWVWLFVLALLAVETWVRRQRRPSPPAARPKPTPYKEHDTQEVSDARVA
jgi:hypothetical protein